MFFRKVLIKMNKICCFAGHSAIYDKSVKEKVREQVITLIEKENVKHFIVGKYGEFDRLCASIIRNLKTIYPDITLELLIPYITKELNDYGDFYKERYDSILMADIPPSTPARLRIIMANRYMIDLSSFLICHVTHSWGGAAQTLEYASKKKNIEIINII